MILPRKDLEKIVRDFTIGSLKLPEAALTDSALLREDLGLDSIDMFDILAHVSQKTGQSFVRDEFGAVRTVSDFMDTLHRLSTDQAARG